MPLDAGLVHDVVHPDLAPVPPDRLALIGVTPVDPAFVATYKKEYRARYLQTLGLDEDSTTARRVRWMVITFHEFVQIETKYRNKKLTLTDFLLRGASYRTTNDITGAPKPLIDLAVRVQQALPKANFEIEYFYTDPILNTLYDDKKACLGIWLDGKVVSIASSLPVPPQPWWRRMLVKKFKG